MRDWFEKNLWWLIILSILIIFGFGFWAGCSVIQNGSNAELSKYRALLASLDTAYRQAEQSSKEAGIARDYFRGRFDSLTKSIRDIGNEVSEIGIGQSDIDIASRQLNDAIRKHGEVLGRLKD